MRPLRLLLALSSGFMAATLLLYVILVPSQDEQLRKQSNTPKQGGFKALLSFTSPGSLFPPSAIISLTDDNSTFFLARPAAFGPTLPADGLSSALWVGSGFGDDSLGKGELGCGDSPDWARHEDRLTQKPASVTRDHSKKAEGSMDDDIQSLQESAEIDGKVVLLKRGQCGFLAKVLWAQRRGAVAVIVGDNVRGGALIRMYAQDDTSNVTIPSIFTSHTTAHLLSSLLPADGLHNLLSETSGSRRNLLPGGEGHSQTPRDSSERTAWWAKWFGSSTANASLDKIKTSSDRSVPHRGLWVTLTPTNVSTSPFFDTLLVLVVSPLVTLTVVYALLLLRSRIRRRRWRAPKSLVERLPVRTYQTLSDSITSATPSATSPRTPLLQHSSAETSSPTHSSHSVSDDEEPATSSTNREINRAREEEKRETGLAEWRRRYGGRQKECVVCLDEYVDGVSQVMSLPCGHEFHADCITPWLVTRRRTCPICKGDVVRSLAQSHHDRLPSPSPTRSTRHLSNVDEVQAQAAEIRNDSPSASLPLTISASAPVSRPTVLDDDVEANWSDEETEPGSRGRPTNRIADLSTSFRELSSTVSTVIWHGVEAVRNTTGFQRRPPEDIDRNR